MLLGDGLLLLWDEAQVTEKVAAERQGYYANIVGILANVAKFRYPEFIEEHKGKYNHIPNRLRCGISLGQVCDLGDGSDYVGPCINQAARLQKISDLSFCVYRQGIDFEVPEGSWMHREFIIKKTEIRGTGSELIYVIREEFEALSEEEKLKFSDP
jgi:hypothetical protein